MNKKRKTSLLILSIIMVLSLNIIIATPISGEVDEGGHPFLDSINEQLTHEDVNFRVSYAEYITTADGDQLGRTIVASNRGNKQMDSHWVPNDARRGGFGDILWFIDTVDGDTSSGLSDSDTTDAISNAIITWDSVKCSTTPQILAIVDMDLGYIQYLLGMGGYPGYVFDNLHAGFLDREFFDFIEPNGGDYILAITLTFIWIDTETGEPTDIDGNKKWDTAFREIYYNDNFQWSTDPGYGTGEIDVETVALHEAGHGLSQNHFGDIFIDAGKKGKVHAAPRAVMNAVYFGVQRELKGTDEGGHCSIWASWSNK